MRVASFFSGIGGFDLGLERAGMSVLFQCEINPYAQILLRKQWPHVTLHDDIATLKADRIPESDVWCAGFPCQDVSLANQGKRQGLKGERSGLFYTFAALVEKKRPKWVFLENVPGLLNSQEGRDFSTVVATLAEFGYGVGWRVLDAKFFGTPQRRRRVFIVASYRSPSAAQVLFDDRPTAIATRSRPSEEQDYSARLRSSHSAPTLYTLQHASIGRNDKAGPQAKGYRNDGETWTLDSRGSSDAVCETHDAFRVRETARVPSRVDGDTGGANGPLELRRAERGDAGRKRRVEAKEADSSRYRCIGNAVAVPVIEWIGRRIMALECGTHDFVPLEELVSVFHQEDSFAQLELFTQ